jgi:hypothetical protein
MAEKCYGDIKLSYAVVTRNKSGGGHIEVFVFHENVAMREVLGNTSNNPQQLLERHNTYLQSSIRARYWLAKVMEDYWVHFEKNLVNFTFVTFK